jgi:NADH dehydrogenase
MIRPGALLMDKLLPNPLVTPQQLDMLAKPNVTRVDAVRTDFGFEPRPMWGNLGYLKRPSRWPKMAA